MSNFTKNENEAFQREVRGKLEDLSATLNIRNSNWSAWELEFIESISEKLESEYINITPKQYEVVWNLWDRI